jgi:hypothetical protein
MVNKLDRCRGKREQSKRSKKWEKNEWSFLLLKLTLGKWGFAHFLNF